MLPLVGEVDQWVDLYGVKVHPENREDVEALLEDKPVTVQVVEMEHLERVVLFDGALNLNAEILKSGWGTREVP
jgi:hypothetical protein